MITDTWGYAVLLAGIWKITSTRSYIPLQILQIVFDSLTIIFIFRIAFFVFSYPRAAKTAAFIYAIFPLYIFFSCLANRDVFAAWALITGLYVSFYILKKIKILLFFFWASLRLCFHCFVLRYSSILFFSVFTICSGRRM